MINPHSQKKKVGIFCFYMIFININCVLYVIFTIVSLKILLSLIPLFSCAIIKNALKYKFLTEGVIINENKRKAEKI